VFLPRIVSRVSPVFPQHLEHIEVTCASYVLHGADTYTRAEIGVISCLNRPKFPVYYILHYHCIVLYYNYYYVHYIMCIVSGFLCPFSE